MESRLQNPKDDDDHSIYDCVLEEIALEGLDGITIQGLVERLIDREGAPITRKENSKVISSIWDSLKIDQRLKFYLLAKARPNLKIWNRHLSVDSRGNVEEDDKSPEDIYPYKCIEVFQDEDANQKIKEPETSWPLCLEDISCIDLLSNGKYKLDFEIEGIKFQRRALKKDDVSRSKKGTKDQDKNEKTVRKSKRNQSLKSNANIKRSISHQPQTHEKKANTRSKRSENASKIDEGKVKNKDSVCAKGDQTSSKQNKQDGKNEMLNSEGTEGGSDWDGKGTDRIALIRGSCEHFDDRKDISARIRKLSLTYPQVMKMFGNRLVIVASQFMRETVLLTSSNQVRIAGPQYCMIERIGRARHYGEQARGKISLTCLNIDAKAQFYHRKALLSTGLIAKQGFIMKFPDGRTGTLISIFHLPRFFRRLESSETINLRKIFAHICNSPNNTVEFLTLQKAFGKYLMKTLQNEYDAFVNFEDESFATLYPEEFEKEKKLSRKELLQKRKVKIVRLKNPETAIRDVIQRQVAIIREDDDTPLVLRNVDGGIDEGEEFDWTYTYNPSVCPAHELEATTIVKLTISRGNKGLLLQDIGDRMEITHLDSRSASRYLTRRKLVKGITEEHDKIKVVRYVYTKCDGPLSTMVPSEEEDDDESIFSGCSQDSYISEFSDGSLESSSAGSSPSGSPLKERPTPLVTAQQELPPKSPLAIPKASPKKDSVSSKKSKSPFKLSEGSPVKVIASDANDLVPNFPKLNDETSQLKKLDIMPTPESPKKASPSPTKKRNKKSESLLKRVQKKLLFKDLPSKGPLPVPIAKPKLPTRKSISASISKSNLPTKESISISISKSKLKEQPKTISPKKERKKIYDDADLKALGFLRRQRAEWSAHEDRCLHYLFLTSVLFIPRYNMQRVFVFNAPQIRDVLQFYAEEARTKTQLAVRRRVHFLIKNRVFFARYRQNLNNALQDENLYTKYVEPYLPPPSMNIFHAIPTEALKRAFEYVRNKFDRIGDYQDEDFSFNRKLNDLLVRRELRRMEAIWTDIWGNVFKEYMDTKYTLKVTPSVLSLPVVKTEPAEVEITIDDTDDNVFECSSEIRNDKTDIVKQSKLSNASGSGNLISSKKVDSPDDSYKADNINNQPWRQKRNRYFDEELQYALHVTKSLLESITISDISDAESDNESSSSFEPPAKRLKFNRETETQVGNDLTKKTELEHRFITFRRRPTSGFKTDVICCERDARNVDDVIIWTGRTALISMIFSGELVESVESFMSSISDEYLKRVVSSIRSQGIVTVEKRTGKFSLSAQMKRQIGNYIIPGAFRVVKSLLTSCMDNKQEFTSLQTYYHLGTVQLLGELGLTLKIVTNLPECIITVHKEWKKYYDNLLKRNEEFSKDKDNFALRLLRVSLNASSMSDKVKFVEKDFFDINLPQVQMKPRLSLNLNKLAYGDSKPHCVNDKIYLENSLIQIVEFNEVTEMFGPPDEEIILGESAWLYDIIHICGTAGVSMQFLLKKFPKEKVKKCLMYLIDCNYIYMVGIRCRKFVAACFMKTWTTAVPRRCDGKLVRRVVMRPWMNAKGGMNWELLDRAYSSIIGVLQRNPVIEVEDICRKLTPVFSPVEVMILILTLIQMGVIEVYRLNRRKHIDMFSKPPSKFDKKDLEAPFKDYNVDAFLEMETLVADVTPFHIINYSQLQSIIHPNPAPIIVDEKQTEEQKNKKKLRGKQKHFSVSNKTILDPGSKLPARRRRLI